MECLGIEFIDFFAGIGGFRDNGMTCVGWCEFDGWQGEFKVDKNNPRIEAEIKEVV